MSILLGEFSIAGTRPVEVDGYLEYWPAMVEKIWAASQGSYDIMNEGGFSWENIEKLIPGRVETIWNVDVTNLGEDNNPDALTDMLDECDDETIESTIIFMSHNNNGSILDPSSGPPLEGIHALHAYGSIEIFIGEEDHHETAIAVRNPWGSSEPLNGLTLADLNDLPDEFSFLPDAIGESELSEEILSEADDGIFLLTIEELYKYFSRIMVVRITGEYEDF